MNTKARSATLLFPGGPSARDERGRDRAPAPSPGVTTPTPRSDGAEASVVAPRAEAPRVRALDAAPARSAIAPVLLAVAGILLIFGHTALSIEVIWARSETFAHGFAVVPIALWLVWRKRAELAAIPVRPWWPGLLFVFAAGTWWLLASTAGAQATRQFGLAFLLQAAIVTVIGLRLARAVSFPLAFLLFAIPAGEFLVPTLIDWTADFTISALRFSGVPVYREANHFVIPSGSWSVVEACSGIRYVIASLMVGTIYAAIAYRTRGRRIAFLIASLLVPVVANWLRAYMIVMLGHFSNNKLAVGVDHIIYGWIFFGVVMLLLFWVGSFWQQAEAPVEASSPEIGAQSARPSKLFAAAIAAILVAAIWPPLEHVAARTTEGGPVTLAAIAGAGGWAAVDTPAAAWRPAYRGFTSQLAQTFAKDDQRVGVYLAFYRNQEKKRELVTSWNALVRKDNWRWSETDHRGDTIDWLGKPASVDRVELTGDVRLEILSMYWINGELTANDFVAKAMLAWSKLRGRGDDSALIVLYAPTTGAADDAMPRLREFAKAMSPQIEKALELARGS